ncbi:MAG: PilZ domain-containing protein [Candidatus Methylomirabilales bacterium]
MKQPEGERRRYARWLVDGQVVGRIRGTDTVALIDLSLGGAQIEHATLVRPGALSFLTLESHRQTVTL